MNEERDSHLMWIAMSLIFIAVMSGLIAILLAKMLETMI
jgi:hypothetical protein